MFDRYYSLKVESRSDTSITLSLHGSSVLIQSAPFRIDFITDGEPVISVNAAGLLKFEHMREKNE